LTQTPAEFQERVRKFLQRSKVVVLAVLITLLVVLVLQNTVERAVLVFIAWRWVTCSAAIVFVSFLMGVFVTLLVLFLRRRSAR
jgi:uncharacterized integral membrane protein